MKSMKILKETQIFQYLDENQMKKIETLAVEKTYKAGTVLYREGDPAKTFYIITDGKVVLDMKIDMGPSAPPMNVTIDVITRGEEMGWSTFVEPHIYTVSALCINESKALIFDAKKLRTLMNQDAVLGFNVMKGATKLIATRFHHTRNILIGERGMHFLPSY